MIGTYGGGVAYLSPGNFGNIFNFQCGAQPKCYDEKVSTGSCLTSNISVIE